MQSLHVFFCTSALTVPLDVSCSNLLLHPSILDASELYRVAAGRTHNSDTAAIVGVATYPATVPECWCVCPYSTALSPSCEHQFAPAGPSCTSACAQESSPVCTQACDVNAKCLACGQCTCLPGYD